MQRRQVIATWWALSIAPMSGAAVDPITAGAVPAGDPHWQAVETGSTASLRGLYPIDAVRCFASGANGTVLRTTDGARFERRPIQGGESLDFRDVHAFDADQLIVISAGTPARIYRSEDAGAAWERVYEHPDERAFFDAMAFWDAQRGIAFSDPIDGHLLIVRTSDGGRSWSQVPKDAIPVSPEGEAGFAASGTCLAVGGDDEVWIGSGGIPGSRVFRSGDGGSTWSVAATPMRAGSSGAGIFSIAMLGGGRGVVVGGDYTEPDAREQNVAVTEDGGRTWRSPRGASPSGYRSAVVALDQGWSSKPPRLIAVGPSGSDLSEDGGESWRRFSDVGFHAVARAADGTVWASGSEGRVARLIFAAGSGSAHSVSEESAAGAGWAQFRGPNGRGVAQDGGYPEEIGPGHNEIWSRAFPPGHSSPVVHRGRVYLTGVEDERLFTYAVDAETGETLWRTETPRPRRTTFHEKNHAAAGSVAVDDEVVVSFFDEFGVVAHDLDGAVRWLAPLGPFDNVYGMGASPILVDDLVIVACDQSLGSYVIALSKADGGVRWKVARPRAVSGHCTPIVRRVGGRTEILLAGSFLLDAYDAATGERLWWVSGLTSEMKSVPVLIDGVLYIHGFASPMNNRGNQIVLADFAETLAAQDADGDGKISAEEMPRPELARIFVFFDLDQSGALDAIEWDMTRDQLAAVNAAMAIDLRQENAALLSGDVTEETVLWRYYQSIPQLPSPLVLGGRYYLLADQGGLVTILDTETGAPLERGRLVDAVDNYFASPVAAEGKVYMLSESGILSVLDATGGLTPLYNARFEDACYATPAFAEGRVWLRTEHRLYCFGATHASSHASSGE